MFMQLLAELGRNQEDHHIQANFHKIWEEEWLPKLVEVVKVELTPTALKRLKPLITDVETDFQMSCCKLALYTLRFDAYISLVTKCFFDLVESLTLKVMCALTYIVHDHKIAPNHEKLFTFCPVSVSCINVMTMQLLCTCIKLHLVYFPV